MNEYSEDCHEVELGKLGTPGWKDIKERPDYCERIEHLKEYREKREDPCVCCPQCCTCG